MISDEEKENLTYILQQKGRRKNESKLAPISHIIMFLHLEGASLQVIKEIVAEKFQIQINRSSINDFIKMVKKKSNDHKMQREEDTINEDKLKTSVEEIIVNKDHKSTIKPSLNPLFENALQSRPGQNFEYNPLSQVKSKKGLK